MPSGNAIGLILPDHLPADDVQVFDVILEQLTAAVANVGANVGSNDVAVYHDSNDLSAYDEHLEFSTKLSSGMVKGTCPDSLLLITPRSILYAAILFYAYRTSC